MKNQTKQSIHLKAKSRQKLIKNGNKETKRRKAKIKCKFANKIEDKIKVKRNENNRKLMKKEYKLKRHIDRQIKKYDEIWESIV